MRNGNTPHRTRFAHAIDPALPNTAWSDACVHAYTHSDEFSMQIKAELQRVLGKGPAV
jgi:hypothetical protein